VAAAPGALELGRRQARRRRHEGVDVRPGVGPGFDHVEVRHRHPRQPRHAPVPLVHEEAAQACRAARPIQCERHDVGPRDGGQEGSPLRAPSLELEGRCCESRLDEALWEA